ncbi:MAG: altronate dehydratase family protein [Lachnospiraceae bacterium]|nr:altronate dehydratase family protein [Lachnospiraceae bacterium]
MNLLKINDGDNVAVALSDIHKDDNVSVEDISLTALEDIARGHKIALRDIAKGEEIIKYGFAIASATEDIKAGSWVHTHNAHTNLSEQGEYSYDHKEYPLPEVAPHTFKGFRREDGRAAIRNDIWIIPVVGCVNSIAGKLVNDNQDLVKGSITGLYSFSHPFGCSQLGDDLDTTAKVLTGLVDHPNAGAVLVLALGCENLTLAMFQEKLGKWNDERVKFLVCQNEADEYAAARKILEELAGYAGRFEREDIDASELVIGMKCGGSDGLSGITANPTVGRFSDRLVALGGTTILTEVPEMFGAEKALFDRCQDEKIFNEACDMVNDFKKYFVSHGQVVYENPSPGNKAGGITTLEDKSLGCVQKGGTAQISGVYRYAEKVKTKGLNLISGPGNDIVSATNLTAAGAHMVLFTTGRGTPFSAPAPTVKISTNSALYEKKNGWIDFNAGTIAEGRETVDEAGARLLEYVISVASGELTKAEVNGFREISILKDGVVL